MSTQQSRAPGEIEAAVVDLANGHLVSVSAEPGAAQFFGELAGTDHDTGEPWRMGFSLPRAAVEELRADAGGHPKRERESKGGRA